MWILLLPNNLFEHRLVPKHVVFRKPRKDSRNT